MIPQSTPHPRPSAEQGDLIERFLVAFNKIETHLRIELQEPDGHNLKILWAQFMSAIEAKRPPVAGVETAHRSSVLPLLGMISWRVGRSIAWDGAKEQIVGDPEASKLLARPYRSPWKYPGV